MLHCAMRIGSRERPEFATRYAASLLGAEFASQELCRFWSGAAREAGLRSRRSERAAPAETNVWRVSTCSLKPPAALPEMLQ